MPRTPAVTESAAPPVRRHRRVVAVLARALGVLALAATALVPASNEPASAATEDGCYTWSRTLSQGASGNDVKELQVRMAGWGGYGGQITIEGDFGPATKSAVTRFQQAYGLSADGVAGPGTFSKIYALQDDDCTPIHFSYSEMDDGCGGSGFDGGAVSEATAKRNALWTMWKLEAERRAMGDRALVITSAFRSRSCNASVGGASNSRHLYGDAADLASHAYAVLARSGSPKPRLRRHLRPRLPGPQRPHARRRADRPGLVGAVLRRRSRDPARPHPGRPRGDPLTWH